VHFAERIANAEIMQKDGVKYNAKKYSAVPSISEGKG
jgi:hypothetical protein